MMMTRHRLNNRLNIELGPHIYRLCETNMIEYAINESLLLFSEFYPKRETFKITRDMAVPFRDHRGRLITVGKFALPLTWPNTNDEIKYIGIASYHILGNDTSDAYSGRGNLVLETMTKQVLSQLPNNRSPFTLSLEQPNIIVFDPISVYTFHRAFTVTMRVVRRLDQVPFTMHRHFENLFIAWVKKIIYNRYKHSKGSQEYAGMEIDTLIDDYSAADDDIEKIIDIFKKDYWKNPELYDDINLYNHKG